MRRVPFVAAVALLAAALAWTSAARGQEAARNAPGDSVTWVENGAKKTRTGVVVESAAFDRVVVVQGGKRTTLEGADVREIRWGDSPREYDAAVTALRAGDAESAAAGFEAALTGRGPARGWLVEEANAGLGEALLALAPADADAVERVARVLTTAREANPKSLVLDRILTGLVRAEILRGRPDAALDAALALDAAAKAGKRPEWEAAAALARAEALDEKNDDPGAVRALDELLEWTQARAAATKDADLARSLRRAAARATVRKTWLLLASAEKSKDPGAAERARALVAELVAKWPDDADAASAAICAEGALLLASGDAKKALRKFLEVEVAHFDVAEEAARALRYEAVAFERTGDVARKAEAMRLLFATYPATEAARRAR